RFDGTRMGGAPGERPEPGDGYLEAPVEPWYRVGPRHELRRGSLRADPGHAIRRFEGRHGGISREAPAGIQGTLTKPGRISAEKDAQRINHDHAGRPIADRVIKGGNMSTGATPQHIQHADRFFIGGEWVKPSSSSRIDVRDSATEEVFLSVAEAQVEDV